MANTSKKVTKCVFPLAGHGTRFLPATKAVPKEMFPIVDKPLIQLAVEEAFAAGIETCIFVTRRGKSLMIDHFDSAPELERILEADQAWDKLAQVKDATPASSRVLSVRQQDTLGLGHAIGCARPFLQDEPFAVILPDDYILGDKPCLGELLEAWNEVGGNVVAVEQVPADQTSSYGILDFDKVEGKLVRAKGMVEKPEPSESPSTLAIIGRYILDASVMRAIETAKPDRYGEIQLTDAMNATLGRVPFHGFRFSGRRFDCGRKLGFLEANLARALDDPDLKDKLIPMIKHMLAEVER